MLKSLLVIFIILITLGSTAFGSDWVNQSVELKPININPLRFTNRARCALDSKKAADSIFVLVTNIDAAKAVYRLAQSRGESPKELTRLGIDVFRYSIVQLLQHTHRMLIDGKLPLLPADATVEGVPAKYKRLMKKCRSDEYCTELDDYIAKVWDASKEANKRSQAWRFTSADEFHPDNHFMPSRLFEKYRYDNELSCYTLKKFGPIQAHLFGTKPDTEVMSQIADANLKRDDYLGTCSDFKSHESIKVAAYQMDIPGVRESQWKQYGFDYWNSLKLYFSWAWRNAPELDQMAYPFAGVFRNVAIEDSVLLVPNGCKSLTPAGCTGDFLSLNTMREFTKDSYRRQALNLDILRKVPQGPQQDLLDDSYTDVNNDILDLGDRPESSEWLENFQQNFSNSRAIMKDKLIRSIHDMNLITGKKSVSEIMASVKADFQNQVQNNRDEYKQEYYYLCSEFLHAADNEIGLLRDEIGILEKTSLIDGLTGQFSKKKTSEYFQFYDQLASEVTQFCRDLDQRKIWDDSFTLEKEGYWPWYLERVFESKISTDIRSRQEKLLTERAPYLAYSTYKQNKDFDNVICSTGPYCARRVLGAVIDLYAVTQYANTFWNLEQKLKAPSLFNPYSERTACQVYDPWFKTKSIIFNLFADLSQAALSTVTPGVLFSRFSLKPGEVTSFNQMVKDGRIEYDTEMDPQRIRMTLISDFGPLLGVPCAVALNGDTSTPYDMYRFAGITAGACLSSEQNTINANSGSDIGPNSSSGVSGCASCQINFEGVAGAVAGLTTKASGFFLIRALIRLYKGLKDPFNIPWSWESDVNKVLDTYKKFGEIPSSCTRSLRKGKSCLQNSCEEAVADLIHERIDASIAWMENVSWKGEVKVKLNGCDEVVTFDTWNHGNNGRDSNHNDSCTARSKIEMPSSCRHLLRGEK